MKKTYMKPEMAVEVLELENMIAMSYTSETPAKPELDMEGKDRYDDNGDWGGLW